MTTIEELIGNKGQAVHSIAPTATVGEAAQALVQLRIGALVVRDGDALVGIISERDVVRRLAQGPAYAEATVADAMTTEVKTITRTDTITGALQIMTDRRIRHLPVLDGGELVGLISIGDLVKAKLADQSRAIADLGTYIAGVPG
jgi:CBS domain-containing protein